MKRVGVVDPGGVANPYGLWDWVGMVPRMGPEARSSTFPLGWPVSTKAGKEINIDIFMFGLHLARSGFELSKLNKRF